MLLNGRKTCEELFVYQMDADARVLQYETSKILVIKYCIYPKEWMDFMCGICH